MSTISCVLVEDDIKLASLLVDYLGNHGLRVTAVHRGDEAMAVITQRQPDIVLLDLMLPGLDGLSLCRQLRQDYTGRILFLTASDDDIDQVAALELGADDYVVKPVQPRVLLARMRMLLRRLPAWVPMDEVTPDTRQCTHGQLTLDAVRKRCQLRGECIPVSAGEFDVLWLLATHPDEVLSRDFLIKETRGIEYDGLDRTVD
ncbi:MAG: response regulator, partial [Natronospirillum sp.]